ncbi:MAG: 3-phosphoshikimate 1-carboxyvinyltransferase [Clostridiales bacterium]|nr:3-phosphoshikimate 1-carboxyvinyltransferase [Clostridiales bacterium]MDY2720849.1 3-phosphoshikimate 1-carboxyvinyltransferase [Eubacteriales bacterium]
MIKSMKIEILPSRICGEIKAPPSKSIAHRALICAALSRGGCRVQGVSDSDDMKATISCLCALGAEIEKTGDSAYIKSGAKPQKDVTLDCLESGSTMRFFIPLSLALGAEKATFFGSERLISRGVGSYEKLFAQKGVDIRVEKERIVACGKLVGGDYSVQVDQSSQFATGLMFALATLGGDSTLKAEGKFESRGYVDLTMDVVRKYGVDVRERGNGEFFIPGGRGFVAKDFNVEGDWSNGAILLALGKTGGQVRVSGLNRDSVQGDKACESIFAMLENENAVVDLSDCPDLAPVAFVVAAEKNGATFTGTRRLKIKESDRAQTMADELAKYGAKVHVFDNSVVVEKSRLHAPCAELCGHNDHRVVMSLAILATKYGGIIDGAQAVNKSFPDFFDKLRSVGAQINEL